MTLKQITDYMSSPAGASLMAHMSGVVLGLSFIVFQAISMFHGKTPQPWDPAQFGIGAGTTMAGVGGLLYAKNRP